ncbi:MAG: FtsX-like permease family protein [Syntrophales bacterium]|jgi:putative ABC transport system permease protein|nr:FtsX-like permease family protein [Syntrophales bacterium]
MRLHNISLNNLRRRRGKTIFLVIGLLIGVTTVVALLALTGAMENDIGKKLDELGANILITPKSRDLALNYGGIQLSGLSLDVQPLKQADLARIPSIKNNENISIVAPKLIAATRVKQKDVLLSGIVFKEELRLKKWWKIAPKKIPGAVSETKSGGKAEMGEMAVAGSGGKSAFGLVPSLTDRDLLVGATAAEHLQLSEGDAVDIQGEAFAVRGILEEMGSQDDALIFADLGRVQKTLKRSGEISLVEVAAFCNTCPIEEMVAQLSAALPGAKVTAVKQAVESRLETVRHFKRFSLGISAVVMFIGSLIVFTTMMASVNERTREIGIFRAIGFRKTHIARIILLEALVVGFLAGILGYLAGLGVSRLTLPFFLPGQGIAIPWDLRVALGATGLSILLGLAASVYPALRAAQLDPAESLRAI